AIEKRISVFSQIPAEHGEQIQVLRYEKDQFYKPHHDYFSDPFNIKRSQRIATMLMYLSDDVEGGETYFPRAGTGDCSCGGKVVKGMSIKPIKGDAVLFWSMVCFVLLNVFKLPVYMPALVVTNKNIGLKVKTIGFSDSGWTG
ncbi:hypothetical protein Gotri_014647, partial [Gossypium trilobum]|nr:hypothetical protein [Gossypium trilobum]